jgi:hypothetical protein
MWPSNEERGTESLDSTRSPRTQEHKPGSFRPGQGWLRPSDGERGTETLMDFDSISERPQNHKPGLIHTKRCSLTGNRRARIRGSQRNLHIYTGESVSHKSMKNSQEIWGKSLNSSWLETPSGGFFLIHNRAPFGLDTVGIYTRNTPPS